MNSPLPLRLMMVPLVCSLQLLAPNAASAAPAKKAVAPVAAPVTEAPAPKRSYFNKLNPFQKKELPPAVAAAPAPAKNSKKSAAKPGTPPIVVPPAAVEPKPPIKSIANVKTRPPATLVEPPKKVGFFSRLKTKLSEDPEALEVAEKLARPADWKERWVITDESTAFFEFGPSQSNGPDLRLPRGQVVKLTQANRGWAKVELEGGRQGYIGTDQMRQAAETDFSSPVFPAGTQLAAAGTGSGSSLQGWSPIAPPPDLPDLPMAAGMENSLLLLPPLEFEGTELKKSSLRLRPIDKTDAVLHPGDTLPLESPAAPEPPTLELEKGKTPPAPVIPAPAEPTPATPTPLPAPAEDRAEPGPAASPARDPSPLPTPAEPAAPSPTV